MDKSGLGTKCTCTACHERFYDLNRSPAVCPKCSAQQPLMKPRLSRPLRTGVGLPRPRPSVKAMGDDAEPVDEAEVEPEDDGADPDDETDDDIEIDADRPGITD